MRRAQKRITVAVRLHEDEDRLVRRIARRRKATVSDVIRDAVSALAEEESRQPDRPFAQIADLIGSVHGLPADLSEQTGNRFSEIVGEKAGRRK